MNKWNVFRIIALAVFVLTVLFAINYFNLLGSPEPETIRRIISGYGIWAPVAFVLLTAIGTVFLFPGSLISIAAGATFPFWTAVFLVFVGDILGATLAFLFSRFLGRDFTAQLLETRFKKLKAYDDALESNGFKTILFFRLIPIFPFNGLNYALALTKVRFRDYFWATFLGVIPGNLIYVFLGDSIAKRQTQGIVLAVSVILILVVAGFLYRKRKL